MSAKQQKWLIAVLAGVALVGLGLAYYSAVVVVLGCLIVVCSI